MRRSAVVGAFDMNLVGLVVSTSVDPEGMSQDA